MIPLYLTRAIQFTIASSVSFLCLCHKLSSNIETKKKMQNEHINSTLFRIIKAWNVWSLWFMDAAFLISVFNTYT